MFMFMLCAEPGIGNVNKLMRFICLNPVKVDFSAIYCY